MPRVPWEKLSEARLRSDPPMMTFLDKALSPAEVDEVHFWLAEKYKVSLKDMHWQTRRMRWKVRLLLLWRRIRDREKVDEF